MRSVPLRVQRAVRGSCGDVGRVGLALQNPMRTRAPRGRRRRGRSRGRRPGQLPRLSQAGCPERVRPLPGPPRSRRAPANDHRTGSTSDDGGSLGFTFVVDVVSRRGRGRVSPGKVVVETARAAVRASRSVRRWSSGLRRGRRGRDAFARDQSLDVVDVVVVDSSSGRGAWSTLRRRSWRLSTSALRSWWTLLRRSWRSWTSALRWWSWTLFDRGGGVVWRSVVVVVPSVVAGLVGGRRGGCRRGRSSPRRAGWSL